MNPFLKRKGGKFYARNQILPYYPKKINTYIEPFLGGGSIFFALDRAGISVKTGCYLNDMDKDIFNIWRVFFEKVKIDSLNQMMSNFSLYSEDVFTYMQKYEPKNDVESSFKLLMLSLQSFQGGGESYYIGIGDINRKMNKLYNIDDYWNKYHDYLVKMNVKISRKDYSVFFTGSFNRDESFINADPPYYGTSGYDNLPFTKKDQENLCRLVHNFKGKVALTLNQHQWVEENYNDLIMIPFETRWAGNIKSDMSKKMKEWLILNYDPAIINKPAVNKPDKICKSFDYMIKR